MNIYVYLVICIDNIVKRCVVFGFLFIIWGLLIVMNLRLFLNCLINCFFFSDVFFYVRIF